MNYAAGDQEREVDFAPTDSHYIDSVISQYLNTKWASDDNQQVGIIVLSGRIYTRNVLTQAESSIGRESNSR